MSAPSSEEGSGSPAEPRSLAVSLLTSISWESWLRVATCSARPLEAPCGIYVCWSQKRRSLAELRSLIVASRSLSCSYAASCLLFILRQCLQITNLSRVLRETKVFRPASGGEFPRRVLLGSSLNKVRYRTPLSGYTPKRAGWSARH